MKTERLNTFPGQFFLLIFQICQSDLKKKLFKGNDSYDQGAFKTIGRIKKITYSQSM